MKQKATNQPARPDVITDEMLEYMDAVREIGDINPLAAGAELQEEFGLTRHEVRDLLPYWAKTFGKSTR